jgi:glycosyltransferase involved in cell wall biosynthesis
MRIVICHNYFRERGGEDQVFEDELELLTARGHDVVTYVKHNNDVAGLGSTVKTAVGTPWHRKAAAQIEDLVRRSKAEVAHFHNWLPQISPAGFYGARRGGAAVVQTLHNYRWVCPKAILFRDGQVCEECVGKSFPWPAIRHACYRDSTVGSTFVTATLGLHNRMQTPTRAIDAFIAPGLFIKNKLASAGIPKDRIYVKPNFLTRDPGPGSGDGGYFMYLGRLAPEKKVDTLLRAWRLLGSKAKLKISGTGPLRPMVEAAAAQDPSIEYLGFAPDEALDGLVGEARALIFTSGTYEAQPMVILETYAKGTPVIAGRLGSMESLVEDGVTGRHFRPGDPEDLARVIAEFMDPDTDMASLRAQARHKYLENFTPEPNYDRLMEIYQESIRLRRNDRQESR